MVSEFFEGGDAFREWEGITCQVNENMKSMELPILRLSGTVLS